jgi:tetratricopeptide (TPR) repeat protein
VSANLQRAALLFRQSRFDLAERELRQALGDAPNDARAHALLGLCLAKAERFDEATREAQEAIALAPDLPLTHYALADILHDRARLDEAHAAILEAIRLDPEDADYRALLANVLADRRRWPEALEAADDALRLDAEHTPATNLRAMALLHLGRKEEAGATIEGALARDPENAASHANLGWNLLHRADHDRAIEHFREALRIDPTFEWAREGLVESLKARYRLYGLLLRYFLWMSRLGGRARWLVLIGAYIGFRVLRGVASAAPALAPLVTPVLILYGAFALSTWLADPLFNLVLRLNRYGRYALSPDQVLASNWVGGVLLAGILSALAGLATGQSAFFIAAFLFVAFSLPVAGTFNCAPGWPRRAMAIYTAVLGAIALAGLSQLSFARPGTDPFPTDTAAALLGLFLVGVFLSGWIANILATVRPKR